MNYEQAENQITKDCACSGAKHTYTCQTSNDRNWKQRELVFVGYFDNHKGSFLDHTTHKITISRDTRFIELGNGSEQLKKLNNVSELKIEDNETELLKARSIEPIVIDQTNPEKVSRAESEDDVFYDLDDTFLANIPEE